MGLGVFRRAQILLTFLLLTIVTKIALAEPLEITFVANSFTGPSKGVAPNTPAIVHEAVLLLGGKISPTYIQASNPRGWSLLKTSSNICLTDKIKTHERMKLGYFSRYPKDIYPPHRLQVHPAAVTKLKGLTSLRDMLAKTNLVIGIAGATSYGKNVMPLVKKYPTSFFVLSGADDHEIMLDKMVMSERVEAVFRPSLKNWPNQDKFVTLPFDEADPALLGYVLCSKSTTGLRAINFLNEVMETPEFKTFFLNAHIAAFPASEHEYIKTEMDRVFTSAPEAKD